MPQIAQQDYVPILVEDFDTISNNAQVKQQLLDAYNRGTILDAYLFQNDVNEKIISRIITVIENEYGNIIVFYYNVGGAQIEELQIK